MLRFVTVALRLRYLVPATAVGGYYSVKRKYEDIKSSLPEMPDFVKDSLDSIDLHGWSTSIAESAQTLNEWFEEASLALQKRSQMSNDAREYSSIHNHPMQSNVNLIQY